MNSFFDLSSVLKTFSLPGSRTPFSYVSLPEFGKLFFPQLERLPISLRIIFESVLRNYFEKKASKEDVEKFFSWPRVSKEEIPFYVGRILLQDFTGVPLLVDLAALRDAVYKAGKDPKQVEPLIPVDLVVDHSVQVDLFGLDKALEYNLKKELERNSQRYSFLKWAQSAFSRLRIFPPGVGICHQVNLEYLAQGVLIQPRDNSLLVYPDSVLGTDSHTTMINGLGIVGWGVGGIEAEAAMLGEAYYMSIPEVVGVRLVGSLREGVMATDLVLTLTEKLRKEGVVGKIVEFFGPAVRSLSVPDRATVANMAPEYGATMGFFPVDDQVLLYFQQTGREKNLVSLVEHFYKAQHLFGCSTELDDRLYSHVVELHLDTIEPSVAGPRRPQDRLSLPELPQKFFSLLTQPSSEQGYGREPEKIEKRYRVSPYPFLKEPKGQWEEIGDGSVVIAAITSCTNTSNPLAMIGAGLLAKKAVLRGLKVPGYVKTSLAPGSRVVEDYLLKSGLQEYLNRLGFQIVGFGCTTCIGNSGPLSEEIEQLIKDKELVVASVLSGNRNFEARIHPLVKANFLMSPPLVVAFALAGTVLKNLWAEPLGIDREGKEVFLKDIWPSSEEIREVLACAVSPEAFKRLYSEFIERNLSWEAIDYQTAVLYPWDPSNTYIQHPPFFEESLKGDLRHPVPILGARALCILGDSITTDHISPAGAIPLKSPAGSYLSSLGVPFKDFNSYGSRRGNHHVMIRGTFGNVRLKNLMVKGKEGGYTRHMPDGKEMSIYDAAMLYQKENVPLIVLAGKEYGSGSSRDWAAKGTRLLGVRAVIAESFERIHRSNLIGMGVLPLEFEKGQNVATLRIDGTELFSIPQTTGWIRPGQRVSLEIKRTDGSVEKAFLLCRIDNEAEYKYYVHGGILPYILDRFLHNLPEN
ncbi:aconitate hydratase AcnA [Candidatus Methylacidiphilum infernorum]|uniref:Aconitate hydratase n=1 Tax=Candidatus Methylacidiphilum infernorum TaxID=511746 RepID=A0ABX7PVG7_9BACT|nr:aconitate hydratase AcnA [Candidatus Methylacidiphilum infernorum]QSR86744.1 aconitate hydratase AcnA [Candidatus Methylacidiphilum infernorum]